MGFTHFDSAGNAIMVDVSGKEETSRIAVAQGDIRVSPDIIEAVKSGTAKKGDVLGVARVAGIMAAKRTSDLIPLTHPLPISSSSVDFKINEAACLITAIATVKTDGKTGVEMEALTAATVALLTIYDMCKAIDKRMVIGDVHLVEKHGGKSGDFYYKNAPTVLAVSGVKNSGKTTLIEALLPRLTALGLKTAVVKHDGHSFTPDTPGTDTFRFFQAGACGTAIFDSEKYSLARAVTMTEGQLVAMFPEADLVLLEGFKNSAYPKLELISETPVCDPETCLAYVSTGSVATDKPVFRPDELEAIAAFVAAFVRGASDA